MKRLLSGTLLTVVMLAFVSNFVMTDAAETAAEQVPTTDNHELETGSEKETETRSTVLDDEAIEARITDALLRNPYTDSYQIGVAVIDGVVTLSGAVNTYFEKGRATEIAASVSGVVHVDNNLRVEREQSIP